MNLHIEETRRKEITRATVKLYLACKAGVCYGANDLTLKLTGLERVKKHSKGEFSCFYDGSRDECAFRSPFC